MTMASGVDVSSAHTYRRTTPDTIAEQGEDHG